MYIFFNNFNTRVATVFTSTCLYQNHARDIPLEGATGLVFILPNLTGLLNKMLLCFHRLHGNNKMGSLNT